MLLIESSLLKKMHSKSLMEKIPTHDHLHLKLTRKNYISADLSQFKSDILRHRWRQTPIGIVFRIKQKNIFMQWLNLYFRFSCSSLHFLHFCKTRITCYCFKPFCYWHFSSYQNWLIAFFTARLHFIITFLYMQINSSSM